MKFVIKCNFLITYLFSIILVKSEITSLFIQLNIHVYMVDSKHFMYIQMSLRIFNFNKYKCFCYSLSEWASCPVKISICIAHIYAFAYSISSSIKQWTYVDKTEKEKKIILNIYSSKCEYVHESLKGMKAQWTRSVVNKKSFISFIENADVVDVYGCCRFMI